VKSLEQYPEFLEFKSRRTESGGGSGTATPAVVSSDESTPEDAIEAAYQRVRSALSTDILQQIMSCSPAFFERLVVDLLVKMGYGGSRRDAGQAIGKSGDGGIDGIIKEDRLGLDVIYIQAKRWEGTVGRPEIQKFVGALQGLRARKGIFITTSSFSSEALQYVVMIESKVVLIDGQTLASFMIDHGVGVSPVASYEIKRVDSDYFTE
jgi:restriction system protein